MIEPRNHPHIPARPLAAQSEIWHFDALSDDGREAVVITFNNNYPFSPRAFRARQRANEESAETFPAVTFTYAVDGKIVLRAVNEFEASDCVSDEAAQACSIGDSSFRKNLAEYGSGFLLDVELLTPRKCRLKAEFEWLSIETADVSCQQRLLRNVVAPRADVSGRITHIGRRENTRRVFQFRGTGYHDHVSMPGAPDGLFTSSVGGRAHFVDSTAIFQSFHPDARPDVASTLVLVMDGATITGDAKMETQKFKRDRYGLVYPGRIMLADDKTRLRVKPLEPIESGFFKKIMTSEITLMLGDGKPRKTIGIVEFTEPGRLKNRVFRWLSDLRIARSGRAALA
ncbi:MAG TPA: hypothetical protein VNA17_02335 [Pyrinomonadaceae bacterium]|nr:hypothetical protein [Pyrinomonadaceae bacterium]